MGRYAEEACVTLTELEILDVVDQIAVVHLKCTSARPAHALPASCWWRGSPIGAMLPAAVPRNIASGGVYRFFHDQDRGRHAAHPL